MKANELRIGNYINTPEGDLPVDYIGGNFVAVYDREFMDRPGFSLSSTKPILLTEEWLVKLGFEKGIRYEWDNVQLVVEFKNNEAVYTAGEGFALSIPCKHVHQLQNLYFALTGEELTIKG